MHGFFGQTWAFCLKIFTENLPEVLNLSSSRGLSCSLEAESSKSCSLNWCFGGDFAPILFADDTTPSSFLFLHCFFFRSSWFPESCLQFKVDDFSLFLLSSLVSLVRVTWQSLENFQHILTHCPSQRDMMEKWMSLI